MIIKSSTLKWTNVDRIHIDKNNGKLSLRTMKKPVTFEGSYIHTNVC